MKEKTSILIISLFLVSGFVAGADYVWSSSTPDNVKSSSSADKYCSEAKNQNPDNFESFCMAVEGWNQIKIKSSDGFSGLDNILTLTRKALNNERESESGSPLSFKETNLILSLTSCRDDGLSTVGSCMGEKGSSFGLNPSELVSADQINSDSDTGSDDSSDSEEDSSEGDNDDSSESDGSEKPDLEFGIAKGHGLENNDLPSNRFALGKEYKVNFRVEDPEDKEEIQNDNQKEGTGSLSGSKVKVTYQKPGSSEWRTFVEKACSESQSTFRCWSVTSENEKFRATETGKYTFKYSGETSGGYQFGKDFEYFAVSPAAMNWQQETSSSVDGIDLAHIDQHKIIPKKMYSYSPGERRTGYCGNFFIQKKFENPAGSKLNIEFDTKSGSEAGKIKLEKKGDGDIEKTSASELGSGIRWSTSVESGDEIFFGASDTSDECDDRDHFIEIEVTDIYFSSD